MIDRAVVAMRLIRSLCEEYDTNIRSQFLFNSIMRTRVSLALSEEKKWEASRLALHIACKWEKTLEMFGRDPQRIITFLLHHFELAAQGDIHDEPIQNAVHALTYAFDTRNLKNLDPTQPAFVRGICLAFGSDRPLQLRKAVFFFLPLISNRWFNSPTPLMEPDEMESFCKDWASAVDDVGAHDDIQKPALKVLFNMINSSHWRPHIVVEKWKLLESFISDPELEVFRRYQPVSVKPDGYESEVSESEVSEPEVFEPDDFMSEVFVPEDKPLRRCLGNLELIDGIPSVGSPPARVLWLAILWLRCEELTPEVREKLETATGEISRADLEVCLSVVEVELGKVEDGILLYDTFTLRQKKRGLEQARDSLIGFQQISR